ncbi:zinc ribbon domain-containing protein [Pontibacter sp. KCTC 32443]|uniref:zinc ribbon domain-containing protein n=1 Tax=Pontibacter TaxID=323449 RepID=UPI00164E487D|nr:MULTISPECIES: zinc ribbon domain-containing protein [Pontibacter]MBC5774554.1 zinc ribbon domain-containing protein [Pontibacter sp. KCTC 32443]
MTDTTPDIIACPSCGAKLPAGTKVCPVCGNAISTRKWYRLKGLNPAEIFLMILGALMLLIGLVAV